MARGGAGPLFPSTPLTISPMVSPTKGEVTAVPFIFVPFTMSTLSAPTSSAPTSSAPTSSALMLSAPTSSAPTSSALTSSAPTSSVPTISAPTPTPPALTLSPVAVPSPTTGEVVDNEVVYYNEYKINMPRFWYQTWEDVSVNTIQRCLPNTHDIYRSLKAVNNNNKNDIENDRRTFMEKVFITSTTAAAGLILPAIANADTQDRFRSPEQRKQAAELADANEARREAMRMQNRNYSNAKTAVVRAEQAARKEDEDARKAEEARIAAIKESFPPEMPRVLVLGGTNGLGKEVKNKLESEGIFVVTTSRSGKAGSIILDVTSDYGKLANKIGVIVKENRCSAVVSCIPPGIGTDYVGLLAGAAGQIASGAKTAKTIRNIVVVGPSPTIKAAPPKGLEIYVKANAIAEGIIKSEFSDKDFTYTILSPGAIGDSKNYGKDKAVASKTMAEAITVAATGFYLGLSSLEADSADKITELAGSVNKVKNLKPYVVPI